MICTRVVPLDESNNELVTTITLGWIDSFVLIESFDVLEIDFLIMWINIRDGWTGTCIGYQEQEQWLSCCGTFEDLGDQWIMPSRDVQQTPIPLSLHSWFFHNAYCQFPLQPNALWELCIMRHAFGWKMQDCSGPKLIHYEKINCKD